MIELASGILEGRKGEILSSHMEKCRDCRDEYNRLCRIMAAYSFREADPAPALKSRVMDSYDRIASVSPSAEIRPVRTGMSTGLKILLPAMAAAALILSILVFIRPWKTPYTGHIAMTVDSVRGQSTLDGSKTEAGGQIGAGSVIRTGAGSFVRIRLGAAMEITCAGDTTLAVESDGNQAARILTFVLKQGAVLSRSNRLTGMAYRYRTPGAVLEPVGTEFVLAALGKRTEVRVLEGRVRLTHSGGETEIPGGPGVIRVDDGKIRSRHADGKDGDLYESLKDMEPKKGATDRKKGPEKTGAILQEKTRPAMETVKPEAAEENTAADVKAREEREKEKEAIKKREKREKIGEIKSDSRRFRMTR
jgi:hypothetical protein